MDFRNLTHAGQTFRIAEVGEGDPVVLLHGFPDGPESWSTTAAAIAGSGFRAIVPFLRGYHPDTTTPGRNYSNDNIGRDVLGLLDALELDRAVLVGHDWGASCVWSALHQVPERVRAVVPIGIPHPGAIKPSPSLIWGVRHFFYFKAPGSDARAARNNLAYVAGLYSRWAPRWHGDERDATVARMRGLFSNPLVLHEALNWYRDLSLAPSKDGLGRVSCPGLLVSGSEEFGGQAEAYAGSMSKFDGPVEHLVVERAGHWPHREGQAEFDGRLCEFLLGLPA